MKGRQMASLTIVYWRDIPAQVIVKKGRESAKVQLTERFEKAIDRAAMRANLRDTDSYLAEWRRAAAVEVSDDLQVEADRQAAELETAYPDERLKALVEAGGTDAAKVEG
jgi:CRISPR/Cas system CSM-associated protein Csm3 (group 7 of RAMP superfamily)